MSSFRLHTLPLLVAFSLAVSCSDDDPTYKPDTTAPVVLRGPTISDITQHSAIVSWRTDDPSTSVVTFASDTASFALWDFLVPVKDMSLVREHSILIASSSLDVYGVEEIPPGTLVHYSAASRNAAGLTTRTPLASFTTLP
jgi:hypothetical protein